MLMDYEGYSELPIQSHIPLNQNKYEGLVSNTTKDEKV